MISRALVALGLVAALGGVSLRAAQHEAAIASGERLFLLARGYDPRSLIEGDYLQLRLLDDTPEPPAPTGSLVLRVDGEGLAEFARYGDEAQAPSERVVRYTTRDDRANIAPETWFIEEGTADQYRGFRFLEVRLTASGRLMPVGLVNEEKQPVGPPRRPW